MKVLTILTSPQAMQLLHTPLLVPSTDNMRERHLTSFALIQRIRQPLQRIQRKDGPVMILAGERMCAHECPIHGRRHLGKEGCEVAVGESVVDLRDLALGGVPCGRVRWALG